MDSKKRPAATSASRSIRRKTSGPFWDPTKYAEKDKAADRALLPATMTQALQTWYTPSPDEFAFCLKLKAAGDGLRQVASMKGDHVKAAAYRQLVFTIPSYK